MTRTIYMKVSCNECGYHGEMDGRTWSPKANHCPKCQLGTLVRGETVRQRGTTPEKAMEEVERPTEPVSVAKPVAELPKELPKESPEVPAAKRYIGSGRGYVENYAKEGKSLEEITKLLEGKLAATTVKVYYGYALKAPELAQVKQKAEKPKAAQPGKTVVLERNKVVLIDREALLEKLKAFRGDLAQAKSDPQVILGINLTIRLLEMMEGVVFIMDEGIKEE